MGILNHGNFPYVCSSHNLSQLDFMKWYGLLNSFPVWKQVLKDVNQQQNTQERLSYPEHTIKVRDSVIPMTKMVSRQNAP